VTAGDPVLEKLFARYRAAVANHRVSTPARGLATAEAVVEARVLLFEHLVNTGWDAPADVRRQLEVDALLLEQPPSVLTG
jgi:hypothetical protein